jgi:predicted GNAT family N-acyltransferase
MIVFPKEIVMTDQNSPAQTSDVVFRRAKLEEIRALLSFAEAEIGGALCPADVVERIHEFNTDTVWAIESQDQNGKRAYTGLFAFLMLNARGEEALIDGSLSTGRPDLKYIAAMSERPAAIYGWAIVARKSVDKIFLQVAYELGVPKYLGVPMYGKPGSFGGHSTMQRYGFLKVPSSCDNLYRLERPKVSRTPVREEEHVDIAVSRTAEDWSQVVAIRSAVFIGEQKCPYREEFDGNDAVATHFLAKVNGEPAATLRFRYFGNFSKMERLAVLPQFRKKRLHYKIVEAGIEHSRRKGFTRFLGHAQEHAIPFYAEFGFKRTARNSPIRFSDYDYFEILAEYEPHPEAVRFDAEPMVVIRPEGAWGVPGVLDVSAARPATNPWRPAA